MANYLARGLKSLSGSFDDYKDAASYYDGDVGEIFLVPELSKAIKADPQAFRVNICAKPVDKLVDRVKITALTALKPNGKPDKKLTKELQRIWDDNNGDEESQLLIRRGAMFGDSYALVEGDRAAHEASFYYNSPQNVRAIYSEENPREVAALVKLWKAGDRFRVNVYLDDGSVERYISTTAVSTTDQAEGRYKEENYEPYTSDDDPDEDSVLDAEEGMEDRLPGVHFRHAGEKYGVPAHFRAWGCQDAVSKIVGTQMGSFDYLGFPMRYGLLDGGVEDFSGDFEDDDDDGIVDTTAGQSTTNKLRSGAGTFQTLKGYTSVGEFDPPQSSNFLEPLEFYMRLAGVLTDTPLHEFDVKGAQPSGESRRRADAGLVKRAENYITSLRTKFEVLGSLLLAAAGYGDVKVKVDFAPTSVTDDKDSWEVIALKIEAGVPWTTALQEAGYDLAEVESWYDGALPVYAPAQLQWIGNALQALGAAKTLTVVSEEHIKTLIPQVFAQADAAIETE